LRAYINWTVGKEDQMPKKVDQALIHGTVAPGFEEVETEFKKNFLERGELGAACAIYHRGEKVSTCGVATGTGERETPGRKTRSCSSSPPPRASAP
jgi:hypothetical protein